MSIFSSGGMSQPLKTLMEDKIKARCAHFRARMERGEGTHMLRDAL